MYLCDMCYESTWEGKKINNVITSLVLSLINKKLNYNSSLQILYNFFHVLIKVYLMVFTWFLT